MYDAIGGAMFIARELWCSGQKKTMTSLYRTVREPDQADPLATNGLPKFLCAFKMDKEAVSAAGAKKKATSLKPIVDCPHCLYGLSFFSFDSFHKITSPAAPASVAKDAIYSVPCDLMPDGGPQQVIDYFEDLCPKDAVIVPLLCYEYSTRCLPDGFGVVNDGSGTAAACAVHPRPAGHHTLHPTTQHTCECIRWGTFYYYYCPPLLATGWSPHCLQLRAQAHPRDLLADRDDDPQMWQSAVVIFSNLRCVDDIAVMCSLGDMINAFNAHGYHLYTIAQHCNVQECVNGIHTILTQLNDASELDLMCKMLNKMGEDGMIVGRDAVSKTVVLYRSSDLLPSGTPKQCIPLTMIASTLSVFESAGLLTADEWNCFLGGSLVATCGSLMVEVIGLPATLAIKLSGVFEGEEQIASVFLNGVRSVAFPALQQNLAESSPSGFIAIDLEDTVMSPATIPDFISQALCTTYFTFLKIPALSTQPQGRVMATAISNCVEHFKRDIWRKDRRTVFVCLSRHHRLKLKHIYGGHPPVPDNWLTAIPALVDQSKLLNQVVWCDRDLHEVTLQGEDDPHFLVAVTFDLTDILHRKAVKVTKKCLKSMGKKVMEEDMLVLLPSGVL